MPAYNCENVIERAIKSILEQEYKNFELIIVDDGSKDNTFAICKAYSKESRIRVFHQENQGPSAARNLGLINAKGKYVMFIDADDLYLPNTVKIMYKKITLCDYDIVTGSYAIFDGNGTLKRNKLEARNINKEKYISYLQKKGAFNPNWNKIYKLSIIRENNIKFDVEKEIGEDIRFNFEYLKYARKFSVSEDLMYMYYLNDNGLTQKNTNTQALRLLNLLIYQNEYYNRNNLKKYGFDKKIFKDFFHIYNNSNELNNSFRDFINNIEIKSIIILMLKLSCNNKLLLNTLFYIYKIIRR